MDINKDLFTKPINELKSYIQGMDVWNVKVDTLKRIIDEFKNESGSLYIRRGFRAGNDWNSVIDCVGCNKSDKKYYVSVYIQLDSTDGYDGDSLESFFSRNESRYKAKDYDRHGNSSYHYATYSVNDKENVLRKFLLYYLSLKEEKIANARAKAIIIRQRQCARKVVSGINYEMD